MNMIGSRFLVNILSSFFDMLHSLLISQFAYVFIPLIFFMLFVSFIRRFFR